MERYRNWRETAPLGALYTIAAVFWIVVQLLFHVTDFSRGRPEATLIGTVVGGLIFAGLLTAIIAWQRRRNGGTSTFGAINRAIRTAQVPEDAEPSVWVPALERRKRQLRRVRWVGPIEFGLFAVLGVVLLISGTSPILAIVLILFFVGFAVYYPIMVRRQLAKVGVLERQLAPA